MSYIRYARVKDNYSSIVGDPHGRGMPLPQDDEVGRKLRVVLKYFYDKNNDFIKASFV